MSYAFLAWKILRLPGIPLSLFLGIWNHSWFSGQFPLICTFSYYIVNDAILTVLGSIPDIQSRKSLHFLYWIKNQNVRSKVYELKSGKGYSPSSPPLPYQCSCLLNSAYAIQKRLGRWTFSEKPRKYELFLLFWNYFYANFNNCIKSYFFL